MIFSENALLQLREKISRYMGDRRLKHTLGVENTAAYIAEFLLRDRVNEIRCAALLHDIAKELSNEELLALIKDDEYELSDEDYNTLPALHSFAAPALILRDFCEYATKDIISSVRYHTLADPGMSLFDKIIFISDYAEEGRRYKSCLNVREFLLGHLSATNDRATNEQALNRAVLMAINYTVNNLESEGLNVNSRTRLTQKALLDII